jgi:hypothetical protein
VAASACFEKSLKALEAPENEPLNWFLGDALREQANSGISNFLLSALGRQRNGTLITWNAQVDLFRGLLVNPSAAPRKAALDLRPDKKGTDANDKLMSLVAEIQTVIVLSRLGYAKFVVLPSSDVATPDFSAEFQGKRVRIEVKNLREAKDMIHNIAADQWAKRRVTSPKRFNFNAVLRHSHQGSLSKSAEKRLRTIIDQFPNAKKPVNEVLDGNIRIRMERISQSNPVHPEGWMLGEMTRDRPMGNLIVISAVTVEHLKFKASELQSLFLKALKPIANCTGKFFGQTYDEGSVNVVVLRWEPPEHTFNPEMISYTQEKIETLFVDFNLPLKVIIFTDPEIPLELLRKYK